jgi:hypothetical protein
MGLFSKKTAEGKGTAALFREFRKLPDGSPLPREGACGFFYKTFSYAGETIPLSSGKEFSFFHIEHDDVLQEILTGTPIVGIESGSGRIILSIVFKAGETLNRIYLNFDLSHADSARILRHILDRKRVEINLLNMVYGEIVKEKALSVPIPGNVLAEIKKAAG